MPDFGSPHEHGVTHGWNLCLDACIALICPDPAVEEERSCQEIKAQLEQLRATAVVQTWGGIADE